MYVVKDFNRENFWFKKLHLHSKLQIDLKRCYKISPL